MPSPPVLDLEVLLAPIAGENPCGENLQYSGLHDEIRDFPAPRDTVKRFSTLIARKPPA